MEADALTAPIAHVVVMHKGPTWDPSDIEPFCRLLSRRFTGEVWAFGSYETDVVIGRMRLRTVGTQPFRNGPSLARFVRRALSWTEELRARRPPRLAVLTLDPFVSGLLGLHTARRAGGVLICEINGVYSSRHNTADTRMAFARGIRVLMRRVLGSCVLRRTNAVRLLFAGQLQGFAKLRAGVVTRQFFETTNLAAFHPGPEEPIVLGVGFPFAVKGFDILCDAFRRISDRYPAWRLVLIGYRVPEELRARRLMHPRIETYPGLKRPEVAEWMSRCAVFALPSRTEAMGRVLLEAAACAKCRVASRVDGIPTVIEDGVDGLLVDGESVDQLVSALERSMADQDLRRRLGNAARLRVEREFSDEAYIERYAELVSAALQRGAM